jgi:hypothetical protein
MLLLALKETGAYPLSFSEPAHGERPADSTQPDHSGASARRGGAQPALSGMKRVRVSRINLGGTADFFRPRNLRSWDVFLSRDN